MAKNRQKIVGGTDPKPHQTVHWENQRGTRYETSQSRPGQQVSSTKSNFSRAMRGRIPKVPNFLALRNQQQVEMAISQYEQPNSPQPTSLSALANAIPQAKRSSDRNCRSPSYYGCKNSSSESTIAAPSKRPRRAGDVNNFQPPPASVVESVQHFAEQKPKETNISPTIAEVWPPAPQVLAILDQYTPTLVQFMTVFEAENQEKIDE